MHPFFPSVSPLLQAHGRKLNLLVGSHILMEHWRYGATSGHIVLDKQAAHYGLIDCQAVLCVSEVGYHAYIARRAE